MQLEDALNRLDQLINKAKQVISTSRKVDFGDFGYTNRVDETGAINLRTSSLSFLQRIFGVDHPYYQEFDEIINGHSPDTARQALGILEAAREEISGGWLFTAKGLVSAEIFSDFLEMASYLLSESYKDAAAVVIGSALEVHLKQLCQKYNIPTERIDKTGNGIPLKADTLNAELKKAGVYNLLDQKNVTAWLDLRNDAAHGNYARYAKEQVELMLSGVQNFISRVSL